MDLKEFEKLLKICRKHGVNKCELEGTKVEFSDLAPSYKDTGSITEPEANAEPSMEELMYFAVNGAQ